MVQRWQLYDPVTTDSYTFPINPSSMGSIHPERAFTIGTTTAINGQGLVTEGNSKPVEWSFEGSILDHAHYVALDEWSKKPYRVRLTDHYGRRFYVAMRKFSPVPKRRINKYWSHDYTMDCIILTTPTAATVGV